MNSNRDADDEILETIDAALDTALQEEPEMTTAADAIREWRDSHPGEKLTAYDLREVLGRDDLRGANLRDAHLREAYLRGADLREADLRGADLREADLRGARLDRAHLRGADLCEAYLRVADLRGADLGDADLRGANLHGTNLYGAYLRGIDQLLRVDGLPSGQATLTPTPDGWALRVGCWHGTPDTLRDLIAQDEGWPEAAGAEVARRRPSLEALAAICDAHIRLHPDLVPALAEKWGTAEVAR